MKAKVNPFYRSVHLSVGQSEDMSIFFDDLDEWKSVVINGRMHDIHFHYEPLESFTNRGAWLCSLVCVYLLWEDDETQYSSNLVTDVKIEL